MRVGSLGSVERVLVRIQPVDGRGQRQPCRRVPLHAHLVVVERSGFTCSVIVVSDENWSPELGRYDTL
jgi:hypothetical protein